VEYQPEVPLRVLRWPPSRSTRKCHGFETDLGAVVVRQTQKAQVT
jgi:hypothetical protein